MQDLTKRLTELKDEFLKVYEKLGISEKLGKVAELEKEVAEPEIWRDVKLATEKNQELARLNEEVQTWELLKTQIEDLEELLAMSDESLKGEFTEKISAMEGEFAELKKAISFQGAYDAKKAIMRVVLKPSTSHCHLLPSIKLSLNCAAISANQSFIRNSRFV